MRESSGEINVKQILKRLQGSFSICYSDKPGLGVQGPGGSLECAGSSNVFLLNKSTSGIVS